MPDNLLRGPLNTLLERGGGYPVHSVHGRIVHSIGRKVIAGDIRPGDRLPREAELMVEFGTSRTAVRDAVKVLASKGLVKTRQRGGTQVCKYQQWNPFDIDILTWRFSVGIDADFVRDLVELRLATEPFAVRLAAVRASSEDLARMDVAHSHMRDCAGDWQLYLQADRSLHMAFFAASHNDFFVRLGAIVHDVMKATFHAEELYKSRNGAELKLFIARDLMMHTTVLNAIKQSDPEAAERSMKEIITFARTHLTNLPTTKCKRRHHGN